VMCFACQTDGMFRAPMVNVCRSRASLKYGAGENLFPWCEVFEEDAKTLQKLQ
jgi:hypothetical protein